MKNLARWAVVPLALVAFALFTPSANASGLQSHTIVSLGAQQSSNWGGYAQGILEPGKAGGFHQVSAKWVVTTARQHTPGRAEHSSTWVGVGGGCLNPSCLAGDGTLIQAGTNQEIDSSGHATYGVWYELIPAPQLTVTTVKVKPGDLVYVDIHETIKNSNVWVIFIKNLTNGQSFKKTLPYSSTHATAEWIVETPIVVGTGGTGFAAMPNLAKTVFSGVLVNGAKAKLTPAEKVLLVSGGQRIATPSAPLANGFHVCTYASSCT
jgi:hypothetical protein